LAERFGLEEITKAGLTTTREVSRADTTPEVCVPQQHQFCEVVWLKSPDNVARVTTPVHLHELARLRRFGGQVQAAF
jgi:hypothetical protein